MSIGDKKERRGRVRSEVLEMGGRPRCHLGDPIRDAEARDTMVRKPIGM